MPLASILSCPLRRLFFLTLIYLGILIALRSQADELAGARLFLVAYQWEVGALFFILILALVIVNRRWGVFAGFGMSLAILVIISFILNSTWAIDYLRGVLFNWARQSDYTLGITLAYIFPKFQDFFAQGITWLIIIVLFF